jgi:hypothetical protein
MNQHATPPTKERQAPLIAPRPNETDEEQRFREAMERLGGQIMTTLDSAIQTRTAAPETQRSRHLVRGELTTVLLRAMNTFCLNLNAGPNPKPIKPRSL